MDKSSFILILLCHDWISEINQSEYYILHKHWPTEKNYPQVQPSTYEIANIRKVSGLHHFPNFKRVYNYSFQTDCYFSFSRETPESTLLKMVSFFENTILSTLPPMKNWARNDVGWSFVEYGKGLEVSQTLIITSV